MFLKIAAKTYLEIVKKPFSLCKLLIEDMYLAICMRPYLEFKIGLKGGGRSDKYGGCIQMH